MSTIEKQLPQTARDFLDTQSALKHEPEIIAFHSWMFRWKLSFKDLKPAHIQSFIRCPQGKKLNKSSVSKHRIGVAKYLIWLHKKEPLKFDPSCFYGYQKQPLPDSVTQFIRSMEPTHKKSSTMGYVSTLRSFHRWLVDQQIELKEIQRPHICAWLEALFDEGFAPKVRNGKIIFLRVYLRWLYERELINEYPEYLIRVQDMPKVPKYLPRPFPPQADIEMQKRLEKSDDSIHLGLLLMRLTGLRIGELISLERECIRRDHKNNCFLKVPLGKLNTERLVPLDTKTVTLVEKIKSRSEKNKHKKFLLETKAGKKILYRKFVVALKETSKGLETNGEVVTHRLRHTYATSLLNGGMSLVGIMKLLGHTDHRMTLRYAEITQETVGEEYFQALSKMEKHYDVMLSKQNQTNSEPEPVKMLQDVIHLIQKLSANDQSIKILARTIVKRIYRIQKDIRILNLKNTSL